MGDLHAAGNPHFMMDPANGEIVARHLADAFCALSAPDCDSFRSNLDAFVKRDTELATRVLNEDDRLDSLKTQVFRDLLTHMLQNQSTVEPSLDLILVSRHLERIGDHATNIAEDVIFMVSALDVRHHLAGSS